MNKILNLPILSAVVLTLIAADSHSETVSPQFFLERCFLALSGYTLPLDPANDSDWDTTSRSFISQLKTGIASGSLSPQNACKSLLRHAELEDCLDRVVPSNCSQTNLGRLKVQDTLSMRILANFHNGFQRATNSYSFSANFPNDTMAAEDFFSSHPYAAGMLYVSFAPRIKAESLVTESSPIMRLGASGYNSNRGPIYNDSPQYHYHRNPNVRPLPSTSDPACSNSNCGFPFDANCCTDPLVPWNEGTVIQAGDTIGAKPVRYEPTTYNALHNTATHNLMWFVRDLGPSGFLDPFDVYDANGSYYYNRGDGGGVMTDPGYLLLQWPGKNFGVLTDSPENLLRRWSKAFFNDFLCNSLPGVRYDDAASFTRADSTHAYWRTSTCMTCHASMDNLAPAVRGFTLVNGTNRNVSATPVIGKFPVTLPNVTDLGAGQHLVDALELASNRSNFYARSPAARLVVRGMDGNFINQIVSGPSELGTLLTRTSGFDDFYACQLSRIFQIMTNIEIKIGDWDNPNLGAEPTSADRAYRNMLKTWVRDLREDPDQSLLRAMERMIDHPIFMQRNFRLEGF